MPLYEFACQECSHTFETLVFDGERVECPECQGNQLERLLSVPAKPRSETTTGRSSAVTLVQDATRLGGV